LNINPGDRGTYQIMRGALIIKTKPRSFEGLAKELNMHLFSALQHMNSDVKTMTVNLR
jgi:hypothetical protein